MATALKVDLSRSSNLLAATWQADTLQVWFKNGTAYRYLGVPRDQYDALAAAESPGTYLRMMIRPSFPSVKEDGETLVPPTFRATPAKKRAPRKKEPEPAPEQEEPVRSVIDREKAHRRSGALR